MPTGYTADVQDGKVTDLREFTMRCARAFGALITMRDDPADAPIPDEFKPSEFHTQHVQELGDELGNLEALDIEGCAKLQDAEIEKRRLFVAEYREKNRIVRQRYEAMLAKVEAWTPPSDEHVELKRFMASQLRESIDFDCGGTYEPKVPSAKDPAVWRSEKVAMLKDARQRAVQSLEEDKARAESRSRWVRLLKGATF